VYSLTFRDFVKCAHSLKGEIFGPAQTMHVLTFEVITIYSTETLDENALIIDFALAQQALQGVVRRMQFQNLDELPEFAGVNTTTEWLAKYIHDRMAETIGTKFSGSLKVVLKESPIAECSYEAPVGR
jgi:6-pyruvoyl-tetrahydropterin synthase